MNVIKNWILPILVGLVVAGLIRTFWFTLVTVDGQSMRPNLEDKQVIIENKRATIRRGDVIIFNATDEDPQLKSQHYDYVKRVIGVAGDQIVHRGSDLYVNHKKINQNYINLSQQTAGTWGDWTLKTLSSRNIWQKKDQNKSVVPKNSYFVLGDNRAISNDSRTFGFIEKKHVLGKAYVPIWQSNKKLKEHINDQSKNYFAK
ncbi:signal peptidase I [Leuconostoc rapi]|uniref:signal peptidase I n=1 Tax=Leuconostoc rapi TaxID=1406906 RepID=UPI00195CF0E7|nr:signal peptidase I [Leuconostoc rapi]MBM7436101.1 signal peptidase I [Leuconostoc rapi]